MTFQEIADLCDELDCKPTPEELLRYALPMCCLSVEAMKEIQEQLEAVIRDYQNKP